MGTITGMIRKAQDKELDRYITTLQAELAELRARIARGEDVTGKLIDQAIQKAVELAKFGA